MPASALLPQADVIAPLRDFVVDMTRLVGRAPREDELMAQGRERLARLLRHDTWLPQSCARVLPDRYAQYLLHCDPLERFCVVSFVWGPGQFTPVHNHTVWGLIGILRGSERCEEFTATSEAVQATGAHHLMQPGDIDAVSPAMGDWHRVSNPSTHEAAVSIHVYGANIGAVTRQCLHANGQVVDFISGYTAAQLPNLWDRSIGARLPQ